MLVRDGGVIASAITKSWMVGALADGATDYLERLEVRERERAAWTR
ncbi:hypothetical protein ACNKHM_19310 [Shigella sonnei]